MSTAVKKRQLDKVNLYRKTIFWFLWHTKTRRLSQASSLTYRIGYQTFSLSMTSSAIPSSSWLSCVVPAKFTLSPQWSWMAAPVPTVLPPRERGARYGVLTPVLFRPRQPISDVLPSSILTTPIYHRIIRMTPKRTSRDFPVIFILAPTSTIAGVRTYHISSCSKSDWIRITKPVIHILTGAEDRFLL